VPNASLNFLGLRCSAPFLFTILAVYSDYFYCREDILVSPKMLYNSNRSILVNKAIQEQEEHELSDRGRVPK